MQHVMLAGKTVISVIQPAINGDLCKELEDQNANIFALDRVPCTLSRGQSCDSFLSQANVAGCRSIVKAVEGFPRFFAGQTAAGKAPPAKVLVLGSGVAGLAAVQTAKNVGVIV
jgi:NAD(P) transhydrogenase